MIWTHSNRDVKLTGPGSVRVINHDGQEGMIRFGWDQQYMRPTAPHGPVTDLITGKVIDDEPDFYGLESEFWKARPEASA